MKSRVFIAGMGMTPFGRFPQHTVKQLAGLAIDEALLDADIARHQIGSAFFCNASQGVTEGQHLVRGQVVLRSLGFEGIPIFNVENACATGASAFHLACQSIQSGKCRVALVAGAEKMTSGQPGSVWEIFNGGWDVSTAQENLTAFQSMAADLIPPGSRQSGGPAKSVAMEIYAGLARRHMQIYGTSQEQLALTASKNHQHSILNPLAQYQTPFSVEEILNSRVVAWPFTVPMCAPVSDGAAALIICGEEVASHVSSLVEVCATAVSTGFSGSGEETARSASSAAARAAYEEAGLGPEEISLAEVHDATSFCEIQQCENLGFCKQGQGGWLAERGVTRLGGTIPVNVSGGLVSKGHPIGVTGISQLAELTLQLRGEAGARQVQGARHAIAQNGGGFFGGEEAVVCVTILGRHNR